MIRLSAILFLSFVVITLFVYGGSLQQADYSITQLFQKFLPRFLDAPFSLFSLLGLAEVTMFIWMLICIYYFFKKKPLAVVGLMLMPFGVFIELLAKIFIYQPPPPHSLYRGILSLNVPSSLPQIEYAYPSGHVLRTAFIVFFLVLVLNKRRLKSKKAYIIALFTILFLMVISRIYLGEHWTSDVIGGLLMGSSFGLAAGFLALKPDHS